MLKRFIIFLGLVACLGSVADARMNSYIAGHGAVAGAPAGDTCSGCAGTGLIFSWYCNSTTVGDTGYSPYGCSCGDTSATANDSVTITSGYINAADGNKYYKFTVSSYDIFTDTEGSVLIDFQVDTFVDNAGIYRVYGDGNNYLFVGIDNTDEIQVFYRSNSQNHNCITTGSQVSVSTRYYVIARWTQSDVDPNLFIGLYNSSETLLDSATYNTNPSDFLVDPDADDMRVGETQGIDAAFKIYSIKVWDTYAGASF